MSIATIGDNLIHYEVLGRGEPVVFIHGWIGSWRYWWPSMQTMATRHRAFAFDLWGFGDSSKSSDKYSFDAYVEMLDEFMNKLGILQPVTLVGHSLGAAVAIRYTAKDPSRVKRVAGVSLPVSGTAIHDRLVSSDSNYVLNRVMGTSYPELDTEIKKTDTAAMNSLARELLSHNFIEDIRNFPRPLLLVFGDQDPIIKQPGNDLPEPNNDLAYIALESCNHFPMLDQTVKFNRLVLEFTHADGNLQKIAPKEIWQRRTR